MNLQRSKLTRAVWFMGAIGSLLMATGCGAKLPVVAGRVTLDGEPLPAATVMFMPADDSQPPAQGTTDAKGKYTLEQAAGTAGIQAGKYAVRITTYQPASADQDPPVAATSERIPIRYNLQTELEAIVEAKPPTPQTSFDFALESGGEIFQPEVESF